MKTILIVISGMADLPSPALGGDTPLSRASTPALDMLARRGEITSFFALEEYRDISYKNALLSILGFDLDKPTPPLEEFMEFGLDGSASVADYDSMMPFVIPGFSGHGVCITTSAWVMGVAKCALLKPIDIYSPGSSDSEILETICSLAIKNVADNEFLLIYLDAPLRASLKGDVKAKIRALENIDRHLISPLADFIWKSEMLINMAITSDLATGWERRCPAYVSVPVILYYNNSDHEGDPAQKFTEVESMMAAKMFAKPDSLIEYLCSFEAEDEEEVNEGEGPGF